MAIHFPETLGQKLPESMEDALMIGTEGSRGLCTCTCVSPKEMFEEELLVIPLEDMGEAASEKTKLTGEE